MLGRVRSIAILGAVVIVALWYAWAASSTNESAASPPSWVRPQAGTGAGDPASEGPEAQLAPLEVTSAGAGTSPDAPPASAPKGSVGTRVPVASDPSQPVQAAGPPAPPTGSEPAEPEPNGSITGALIPDTGAFHGDPATILRGLNLDLVSRGVPHLKRTAELRLVRGEQGELVRIDFTFDRLPQQEFELTLSSLDAQEWYPASMFVIPPAEGLEFRCLNDAATVGLDFDVTDAATGEAITGWTAKQFRAHVSAENGVLLHAGPLDLASFPIHAPLEWILEAPGYAPAFGTELAFSEDSETGRWRAAVALERGYAVRLVTLAPDPELRPAAGAIVELDGEVVGTTDSNGQLFIRRAEAPKTAKVTWRSYAAEGPLGEVCMPRPNHLRVTVLR